MTCVRLDSYTDYSKGSMASFKRLYHFPQGTSGTIPIPNRPQKEPMQGISGYWPSVNRHLLFRVLTRRV